VVETDRFRSSPLAGGPDLFWELANHLRNIAERRGTDSSMLTACHIVDLPFRPERATRRIVATPLRRTKGMIALLNARAAARPPFAWIN
jgi:hypothetical protein